MLSKTEYAHLHAPPPYCVRLLCAATPAELRARFRHASSELAFLGFVRPYKRKRKQDEGLRGPKGAMERLVFAYSMQSGM